MRSNHERYIHDHIHLSLDVLGLTKSATVAINERCNAYWHLECR